MSHGRRKVFDAKTSDDDESAYPLALLGQLYDIERRGQSMSVSERTQLRQGESRLILDSLHRWLHGPIVRNLLPSSKLSQAAGYLRNHWEALCVYTSDGSLPIDNNWVERLMRRVACGRKNWLFVGSLRAGMRNAALMSLVASAHRHDLDIHRYLTDVIEHMVRGTCSPQELLPDRWKQCHPEAVRQYREEERRDKAEVARVKSLRRRAGV